MRKRKVYRFPRTSPALVVLPTGAGFLFALYLAFAETFV
jgi:hypothetical protein